MIPGNPKAGRRYSQEPASAGAMDRAEAVNLGGMLEAGRNVTLGNRLDVEEAAPPDPDRRSQEGDAAGAGVVLADGVGIVWRGFVMVCGGASS